MKKQVCKKNYTSIVFRKLLFLCQCTFVLLTLNFSGCAQLSGYSNESLFPHDVRSVYLEMFDNQGFRRGVEYELSDAISKRVETDTPYKIVSSADRADTLLSGRITSIGETGLTIERETGRLLEKELQIQAIITWKNLKTGELLIDNLKVKAAASYSEYQQQDFNYASKVAANNLARKIVEQMEVKW